MLYPNFNELVAYKNQKIHLRHPSVRNSNSSTLGNHRSAFRGQGMEFDSVREYVVGDDIRSIDWRVTARTGSPHLKVFKEDRERHIVICVDMNAYMRFGTRNTFKSVQAAKIAAMLGWQSIAQQDKVSIFLYGDVPEGIQYFSLGRTSTSFVRVLKILSEAPKQYHEIGLEKLLQQVDQVARTGSIVYVISDFMNVSKELQEDISLIRLRKKSKMIFVSIQDPADKVLCPMGVVEFSHHQDKYFANTDSDVGRKAYEIQWQENRKQLDELTSKFKITKIELTTESDVNVAWINRKKTR